MLGSVKSKSAIFGCLFAFAILVSLVALILVFFAIQIGETGIGIAVIIAYLVELFYIAKAVISCKNLKESEAGCDGM